MRSWKFYRAAAEQYRAPNVFPGPLRTEADAEDGDKFVHYIREGQLGDGTDYFGVYCEDGDHAAWLAVQPAAVGIAEVEAEVSAERAVSQTPAWAAGHVVLAGDWRIYDDELYSCIQGHATQPDWTPDVTPALWRHWPKVLPGEDYPPWKQPLGGHDAHQKGDRVSHNGQNWESTIDANVWEPGSVGAEAYWKVI